MPGALTVLYIGAMQSGLLIFLACLAGAVSLNTKTLLPGKSWPLTESSSESQNVYVRPAAARFTPKSVEYENATEWQHVPHTLPTAQEEVLWGGASAQQNLCINGRFVPELFIIGAIQAATTSLSMALRQSPMVLWARPHSNDDFSWKEAQVFDRYFYNGPGDAGVSFPPCSPLRKVAVDATPAYSVEYHVPQSIRLWYGTLAPLVKFVLVIREPVARMHSHYHHSRQGRWCKTMQDLSFEDVADKILHGDYATWVMPPVGRLAPGCNDYFEAGCACNHFVEASLYAKQLTTYFNFFPPNQFLVVPFKYVVDRDTMMSVGTTLVELMWAKLGVSGQVQRLIYHSNQGIHTALEKDLPENTVVAVRSWFNNVTGPDVLARLISSAKVPMFGLANRDYRAIASWIVQSW